MDLLLTLLITGIGCLLIGGPMIIYALIKMLSEEYISLGFLTLANGFAGAGFICVVAALAVAIFL